MRELEETKEQAAQFERTARWWNESCVKWREKWGKENTEKKKLLDEVEMLNGRNRALIIEFQRMQAENSKLNVILQSYNNKNNNQNTYQQPVTTVKEKQSSAFPMSEVPRDEDEKRVARVEPIVEEVRMAKTINNESPTSPERPRLAPDIKVTNRYLSPLSDIEEQLDSLDLVDGAIGGGDKKYDVVIFLVQRYFFFFSLYDY